MHWILIASFLAVVVYALRVSRVVESLAFYAPSRAAFGTPEGIEDVQIPSRRGGSLHGWWVPAADGAQRRGTVLFCHGNAGNLPDHIAFVRGLPEAGFDVLLFDYAGFGRSPRPRRIHRDSLLRDAEDAYRYLVETRGIDPQALFLHGHSMGGVTAIRLAALEGVSVARIAAVAPFASFPRVAADHAGPIGWLLIDGRGAAERAVEALDPSEHLLLIHGDADRIVPSYHSERLADAASKADVECTTRIIPDADHVDVFDPPHDANRTVIEHFLSGQRGP